jgi:CRP-like cAMP-binding protein
MNHHDVFIFGEPASATIRDRVLLLRSLDLLAGLDEEGLTLLAEHATSRRYRKGDVVMTGGEGVIHIVVEGQISTRRGARTVSVGREGWGLGMLELFAGVPADRAVADLDSRTVEIPRLAFQAALEENFSLVRNAFRLLGNELADARRSLPADPERPPKAEMGAYYERPRTLAERMIELKDSPLMLANVDALVDFSRCMVEHRVPAGHLFWSTGEPATFSIHVNYGRVRCTAPDGRSVVIGSDFTLGVMDVWGARRRFYDARSETSVICYRVEFENFLTIVESHAGVCASMLSGLAKAVLQKQT